MFLRSVLISIRIFFNAMENSKMQDYKNSSCSINPTTIKPRTGRVLICKNSMRLRWDPPLEIQVLTVLRNYEKNIKKRKLEKVISCYTSDLEQKIFTKLYSVKNSNLELLAQLKDIQT